MDPTANRPPAAAAGTLGKTPLLHLLVYALGKKLSGTMEFSSPDGSGASVLFVSGEPARVRTSARGLQSKPSEGEELGRKLRIVAGMPAATEYAYFADFDAVDAAGPARGVDPVPLLWEILREHPPREQVIAGVARLGRSGVRLATTEDVKRLALPSAEALAVERLRGHSLTPPALAIVARLDEGTVQLLVYLLLLTKQVDIVISSQARPPAPTTQTKANPSSSAALSAAAPPAALPPEARSA